MSEKRWALKRGVVAPRPYPFSQPCCEFEEVEVPGHDESIVSHAALRSSAQIIETEFGPNFRSCLRDYLPQPQRPTFREAMRSSGNFDNAFVDKIAAKCGIDPDKRMEP